MPYFGPSGPISGQPVTLQSGTVTATGQGGATIAGSSSVLRLKLDVTAASGTTPSMTVNVQHSGDGTTWATLGSFAAATAVTSERKVFAGVDEYVRVTWTVTGTTPSFTFSVAGALV